MYKLFATIRKDIQILIQDKVGLTFMFSMPIVLVVVMTAIQNSTFDLVNKNKLPLLISNQDTGRLSKDLLQAIGQVGLFKMLPVERDLDAKMIADSMHAREAMLAVVIPPGFSSQLQARAKATASKALHSFGLQGDTLQDRGDK